LLNSSGKSPEHRSRCFSVSSSYLHHSYTLLS
jgi:hypothetical protein